MTAMSNPDDLDLECGCSWADPYRQSKLANVMFALELNGRVVAAGRVHAGYRFRSRSAHSIVTDDCEITMPKSLDHRFEPLSGFGSVNG